MLHLCDECGQMTEHRGQLNYCDTCEDAREQHEEKVMLKVMTNGKDMVNDIVSAAIDRGIK